MNGLETVFRTFDFAQFVLNEVERAGVGRGMEWKGYTTGSTGQAVPIPQWWLRWFEPDGNVTIGVGSAKVSERCTQLGHDPVAKVGFVIVGFWHQRGTDRHAPILKPQVLCGVGEAVTFAPWGGADFKRYLKHFADSANAARRNWAADKPSGAMGQLNLGATFNWMEPVDLESLDTPDIVANKATEMADFMAPVVTA